MKKQLKERKKEIMMKLDKKFKQRDLFLREKNLYEIFSKKCSLKICQ